MRQRILPIIITILIVVLGHVILRLKRKDYEERREFTIEFQNNFIKMIDGYCSTGQFDPNLYGKFIHDVDKIQEELGLDGVVAEYYDPLRKVGSKNYQIFVNLPNELRIMNGIMSDMRNSILVGRFNQTIGLCDDSLRRHGGNIDRAIEDINRRQNNPISCFGEGIRWIVGLPGNALVWIGIVSPEKLRMVCDKPIAKLVGNLFALIGLISSIITIILGWQETVAVITGAFPFLIK